ncbi:MAG: N-acetylglucosamine-6-phosphate deacetylase [Pseudomonadota bacterium]|nr:N-acetylglucosamine-6-phosphate deacetylase [Alteromonadaceae bacterium]MCP4865246.1 N-acetylglucosamine-6-phosphate deacetylase [Alteromonas sp.]MDY6928287.1 N-acetylglucosamine-6-phosphate deacetylase [Pseudomonadota bacterium]RPH19988.1 MAG: N-acetylglucosamine-6-phosphate deacetylase [Alteromonadaceae bacterium TMED7]|tara:strand:+ start:406 stop:1536 length:1131 start_codon:yes stop_codon:yes gene_type:complete
MKMCVQRVITPEGVLDNTSITVEDGIIVAIEPAGDKPVQSGTLMPGYFDTQVNGGGGVLFNQHPDAESLNKLASAHLRFGTTSMLPTLITDGEAAMARAADAIAEVIASDHPTIVGVHFEGPFLNVAKKGVHEAGFIRHPKDSELAILTRPDLGKVLVTVAPDTVDVGFIRELVAAGVVVALGHSNATYEQAVAALAAGATGFTHLYNAMSALQSRAPGMVGAALNQSNAYCGLIVDHHHVHSQSAALAIKTKTAQRIMLVTDAMAHVGTDITELAFFSTVIERHGDKLVTPEGTLAGSCLDMHTAVLNSHRDLGFSLAEVSTMASLTPARFIGREQQLGSIAVGQTANLLLLDEALNIETIWLRGKAVANGEITL